MRLARATAADAEMLSQVQALGFDAAWPAEDIAALFDGPGVFGFLVFEAARPVGMILCRTMLEDAEVLTLAVDPAVRGRGVGAALVAASVAAAKAAGATAVFLEVAVDNAPALALYARAGFHKAGVRNAYYDRGAAGQVDAVAMRLDLPVARP
ncbi:GNAT family N-acetyltransferase [Phenylobacterium sp.]|jgi:ribosomal-protein-alanine N-acetyltransferase|uniref:GNAT family N-acetyltransferase n=1 Tax=Phenylobacterium sp. TaxID=1871053 RepID=UPI002F41FA9E